MRASKELLPLVVDLDGTLTLTDTLAESVVQIVKRNPLNLVRLPVWLLGGRASFKRAIASRTHPLAASLPYRQSLVDYLTAEKSRGRRIVLATAAHRSVAENVATHLELFDDVLATDGSDNLKGSAKLAQIQQRIGRDFVYAGDSSADLPIWQASQGAVLAGVSSDVAASVRSAVPVEREFANADAGLAIWIKALRVHQWLKNLLLFVPLFTAFSFFDTDKLTTLMLAFVAMSLGASGTYILNDLWDLANDRQHPRKCTRPFASGALSIANGLGCSAMLLVSSLALGLIASPGFAAMLALYLVMTSAYSWTLKKKPLIDVIVLSLLYTLRIFAGSVAVDIPVSKWLLAFSLLTFLSLALVKRCAELVSMRQSGAQPPAGRDYRVADLEVLWPLGIGAALSAVVVFGLFINSADTVARYGEASLLWLVAIGFIYLLGRLWLATVRGEMDDDPVVFVMEDRGSRITMLSMVAIVLLAHFTHFP
ncbi:UbiA family prenyltransferase [Paraburkholderia sp. D15]|uniref:UbiA family prenyltransferase n=1 Tax=Paraburkholderia sp. D15 TaxID=2880218 RepID=UPI002479A77D|nr:UbiA family prenyltransferase [Paraburkholderia sp. D15]WGS54067.1 UbiA family prenyltransferase [Paraburkholderia sp. D15]